MIFPVISKSDAEFVKKKFKLPCQGHCQIPYSGLYL